MKLFTREVIATMSTLDLIDYRRTLLVYMANNKDSDDADEVLEDVELELIRRDDVPEEHFALIDAIQKEWSDDFED